MFRKSGFSSLVFSSLTYSPKDEAVGQILPAEVSSVALLEVSESDSAHLILSFQLRKRIEPYDCAFSYMRSWFDPHVSCISKSVTPTLLAFFFKAKTFFVRIC